MGSSRRRFKSAALKDLYRSKTENRSHLSAYFRIRTKERALQELLEYLNKDGSNELEDGILVAWVGDFCSFVHKSERTIVD